MTQSHYLSQCWLITNGVQWHSFESNYLPVAGILTHWGRVMHICVGNLTIIGSDNGLSLGRRQAIIWTIVGILLVGTKSSEILITIHAFSITKMHLKGLSAKWRPSCLGFNVLRYGDRKRLVAATLSVEWFVWVYLSTYPSAKTIMYINVDVRRPSHWLTFV